MRGMAHDVTEQERAERLLSEVHEDLVCKVRERESTIRELKLFRTLVDRSNDSIQVVDPRTLRFLDANEKACIQLGYSREELLSLGVFDFGVMRREYLMLEPSPALPTCTNLFMSTFRMSTFRQVLAD